jgi:organic hydroperoxide reductase OsmC/OhrA
MKTHTYDLTLTWTGNTGTGTATYRSYHRDSVTEAADAPPLPGSSDPAFRGDPTRWNPEQLLVASISQCHMLWYLHLCAVNGVVVTAYTDQAHGEMTETPDGGGHFTQVTLNPQVTVAAPDMMTKAGELHERAHQLCFIANSVNFPITHTPTTTVG